MVRSLLAAGLLASMLGCEDPPSLIEIPPLGPVRDGGFGAPPPLPDGAIPCDADADCDDGVECTADVCQPGGFCVSAADNSRCSDGIFCNGSEVCDPIEGCTGGVARSCNDGDVCTLDRCDEQSKACLHEPRDFDDDGEVDWHCFGGTDCDDFDATRGSQVAEICSDGIDNDCDDATDEQFQCGRPEHDTCDDALDISAGGTFQVGIGGAASDYTLSCDPQRWRDVTFSFELQKPRDVTLIARGILPDNSEESAAIAVRGDCEELQSELDCARGFPAQVRMRALPAGRYYVLVTAATNNSASHVVLEARFDKATKPPPNMDCSAPIDVSAGGRYPGDFIDVSDDQFIPCGFVGSGDLSYMFTTEEERDVTISAISATGDRMNFAVRSLCDAPDTTLRCETNAPAWARLHQLPAGTYYILLEGPPSREVNFNLDVGFLPPTAPPPGDGCADPLSLEFDEMTAGTLVGRQDLVSVQCGCAASLPDGSCGFFLHDAVYALTLDEPADVGVQITGGEANVGFAFQSECGVVASQLACDTATEVNARVRNVPAGTHHIVVESLVDTGFSLSVEKLPLTVPESVEGNDRCEDAHAMDAEGGLFTGSTLTLLNDYEANCGNGARSSDAVYRLDLPSAAQVTASLTANFDAVLQRYEGDVADCVSKQEASCDDDSGPGSNARLDEALEAGTHFYVIDGFGTLNSGTYTFEVVVN